MQTAPRILATVAVALAMFAASAFAETRYPSWQTPDDRLGRLLDDLQSIVDEGYSARAAHPAFLGDLQEIIDRYQRPPRTVLLWDDFSDSDLGDQPAWEVVEGDFHIDRGELRTTPQRQPPSGDAGGGDPALRLLIGILGGLSSEEQQTAPPPRRSVIATPVTIENRFTLELRLRSPAPRGEWSIGVTQGETLESGYHLIYRAGVEERHPLQLVKYLRGRRHLIAEAGRGRTLDDGEPHALRWSRDVDGTMVVTIDGEEWLRARDTSYRDRFTGLAMVNRGGVFGVDDVELYTTY